MFEEILELAEFEPGDQQEEEHADEEVDDFGFEGLYFTQLRGFFNADDETGDGDGEQSGLGLDQFGGSKDKEGAGEGEGVDVLGRHPAPGEHPVDPVSARCAEADAADNAKEEVGQGHGAPALDGPLEAEDGDEDADRVDQHAFPVKDAAEALVGADPPQHGHDDGGPGDDDKAAHEEREGGRGLEDEEDRQ